MKKISFLILILLMIFSLTSCKKTEYKSYNIGEEKAFIDKIYSYIDKGDNNYLLIDVRSLNTDYANGHFRGFINYDIANGNIDEFVYRITSMYSKEKSIFIIDKDGSHVKSLMNALKEKKYKRIYIYLGGYDKLNSANQSDFEIITGTNDCGC